MSNIFTLFARADHSFSLRNAILFKKGKEYQSLSYAGFYKKTLILGNFLKDIGIHLGDKVCILIENQPEYPTAFLAIMYAGGVAVPLDTQFSFQQINHVFVHAEVKLLIVTERIYQRFKDSLQDIEFFIIDSLETQKKLADYSAENKFIESKEEEKLAVLFYTSGTTDVPKAVMLTHNNLLANFYSLKQLNLVNHEDCIVSLLPLHHAYSFTVTLLTPLLVGASIVYPPSLSSIDLLACLQKTRPTIFVGVPQVFSLMRHSINQKLKSLPGYKQMTIGILGSAFYVLGNVFHINFNKLLFSEIHRRFGGKLKYMVSGGARLSPEIAKAFTQWGFTIFEGYGLTETSPVSALNPIKKSKMGSVGQAIPQVDIKIIEPNEKGIGEVAIKGANVMKGYYKMPRQTQEALKEGWFYTGDLGYVDQEGYLFLTGRKKELIVLSSGKNIVPEDVEELYGRSPYIKEMCVLGHQSTSFLEGGEHLVAIIVANEEYFKVRQEAGIYDKLKWEMDNVSVTIPSYKHIQGFVISQEPLPRTRLGKLMRHQCAHLYETLRQTSSVQSSHSSLKEEVSDGEYSNLSQQAIKYIREALNRDVGAKDHLELDLGLDSLGRVELLMGIQEGLNLELSEEMAMNFFMSNTVQELLDYLKEASSSPESQSTQNDPALMWRKALKEDPPEGIRNNICLSLSVIQVLVNLILIGIFKIFFRVFFLLRVEGRENLKANGPYLICPNHTSYLDGLIILSALPFRLAVKTYFLGEKRFFEQFLLRPFIKLARLIPLQMNSNLMDALKACSFVLRNSKIVCYFPEGQRAIDGEIKEFKKGVGILVKELDIPVVPVSIQGAFKAWPRGRRFPRLARIRVTFGNPARSKELNEGNGTGDEYQRTANALQKLVINMRKIQKNVS